jgi:hypothetical protein
MRNGERAHPSALTLFTQTPLRLNTNNAQTADYILRERLFFFIPQKQRLSLYCVLR